MALVRLLPTGTSEERHRIDLFFYRPTKQEPELMVEAWIDVKFSSCNCIDAIVIERCIISAEIFEVGEKIQISPTGRGDYPYKICA